LRKLSILIALALLLTAVTGCSKTEKPADTTAVQNTTASPTSPEPDAPDSEEVMFWCKTKDSNGNPVYHHISGTGEILLETSTKDTVCHNGLAVATSPENGLVGYKDQNGEYVIQPQFQAAGLFSSNGLAPVQKDEKWGFVNKQGEIVVPCEYGTVTRFNDSGYAVVYTEDPDAVTGLAGIIDSTGSFCLPLGEHYGIQLANEYFIINQTTLDEAYDPEEDAFHKYRNIVGCEIRNYDNQIVAEYGKEDDVHPSCAWGDVYYAEDWHILHQFIDGQFVNLMDVFHYSMEKTDPVTIKYNIYNIMYNGAKLSDYEYSGAYIWPPYLFAFRFVDDDPIRANERTDIFNLSTGEMTAEGLTYCTDDDYGPAYQFPTGYFIFLEERFPYILGVFDSTGKFIIEPVYDEIYSYDTLDAQFPW